MLRWVQKVAEFGYGAVALADVNSMSGLVDLCKAARGVDVQPILGVEILTESQQAILLAEDSLGYSNLCQITTARNLNPDFDLVEQLGIDSRGVICIGSQTKLLDELKTVIPPGHLFAGCRDSRAVEWATSHRFEPIAWTGVNWLDEGDKELARLLARIRQLSVAGPGPHEDGGLETLAPAKLVEEELRHCPRALANADRLVERCRFRLLNGKPILPKVELGKETTSDRELGKLCHVGMARKYNPVRHEVVKRLEYELATVKQNGFTDYFLVVHEIVNFAKQNRIPVEVRGSAAGSLIAYVLGFTRVCPVENRLYFERFMNPGRTDCPDIDIDLCWRRRDEVIRFCYERWGFERVAMVCNINRYRLRSAIRDVGRAMGLEPSQINQLAREGKIKRTSPVYRLAERLVGIPRHLGVHCGGIVVTPGPVCRIAPLERANKGVIITQYDKDAAEAVGLIKIDLLGNRALSTVNEAIQVIRSRENVTDDVVRRAGLDVPSGGSAPSPLAFSALNQQHEGCRPSQSGGWGARPTLVDRAPGIRAIAVEDTVRASVAVAPQSECRNIAPLSCYWPKAENFGGSGAEPPKSLIFDPNDSKTADMLSAGDSLGVFQSESPGMRQLLRGLKVRSKRDLAIALSLIRPGPASGGMKAEFIERHVHNKPFEYLHPKIAGLLGDTHGVMLFQEDVMRIAVEVAGYTVAEADRFRSEVSKKVSASRLQAQYVDFVRVRAQQAGIDRKTADAIWDEVLRFAAYSYCKAHATVYANIAWETAWLKAHYPQEFYCSLFNNHQGMYPLRVYVWDAKRHGIQVLPPHVNHSEIEWSLQDNAIRAGLNLVKGLTGATSGAIVEGRRHGPFHDLADLRRRIRFRRPELQNLIHVGACDGLGPTRPAMLGELRFALPSQEPTLFDIHASSARNLPDYDGIAKLEAELDVTGVSFAMHPSVLLPKRYVTASRLHGFLGRTVTVAGFVATARRARTSDNRVMGFVTLEDTTGMAEISFFPDKLPLYRTICSYGGPVWVAGRITEHLSSLSVDCSACGRLA
ncbi:MAG: DNA polymerase III subunit alpha [Phycisphaerae bacterium]|nr:DNA polymerase III subunit alpha [Phycisphaerae bacterium]